MGTTRTTRRKLTWLKSLCCTRVMEHSYRIPQLTHNRRFFLLHILLIHHPPSEANLIPPPRSLSLSPDDFEHSFLLLIGVRKITAGSFKSGNHTVHTGHRSIRLP